MSGAPTFPFSAGVSGSHRKENMMNNILTLSEMRELKISTAEYELNLSPGIYYATIDLMAEARDSLLRVFLTFDDGRKIFAPASWYNDYMGFRLRRPGDRVQITYKEKHNGKVFPVKAVDL